MNKSSIVIIIYVVGIVFGALFLDLWGSETNLTKPLLAMGWTAVFLIALFYSENDSDKT